MDKFNKFTYKPVFDLDKILYGTLTRNVLTEKIPINIKRALLFGWKKDYRTQFRFDVKCHFCGKMTTNILVPYVSENSNKCLDICVTCDELMISWKN